MGMKRRAFLGLTAGLTGGLALGAAASPFPWQLARDLARWSQDPSSLPPLPLGQLKLIDTVSRLCPNGAGIRVLAVQGRPLLALGNPEHPLSRGAITPLGLAEVASLHHPARIAGPLRRVDKDRFEPLGWSQAREVVLEQLRQAGPRITGIIGDSAGVHGAPGTVLAGFLGRLGSTSVYAMPSEGLSARQGVAVMGGQGQPGYDLDNARLVVALGADAMESLPASLSFRRALSSDNGPRFVALGPCQGQTSAMADEWIPLPAGKEAWAALGLAWHLFQSGFVREPSQSTAPAKAHGLDVPLVRGSEAARKRGNATATGPAWSLGPGADLLRESAPDLAEFKSLVLARFGPRQVEEATGITPARLAALARELAASPAAVVIPGSPGGEGVSLAAMVAGLAVNVLLGRLNRPGGMYLTADSSQLWSHMRPQLLSRTEPQALPQSVADNFAAGDLPSFLTRVAMGQEEAPQALLVAGANPVAGLPNGEIMARGVAKAGFKICFNPFLDETARLCDLILPGPLPLEGWGGVSTPYGVPYACFSLGRPLVRPAADARDTGDFLLDCAARLGVPMGFSSTRQILREQAALLERRGGFVAHGIAPWEVLAGSPQPAPSGDLWRDLLAGRAWADVRPASGRLNLGAAFLAKAITPQATDAGYPLILAPQPSARTGTPCLGLPLQSLSTLRESELRQGASVARMNAATALSVRVKGGDRVRVVSSAGAIPALMEIDETVMDGHVALLSGLGRLGFDDMFKGLGANVRAAMVPWPEPGLAREPEHGLEPEPGPHSQPQPKLEPRLERSANDEPKQAPGPEQEPQLQSGSGMAWNGCAVGVVKE